MDRYMIYINHYVCKTNSLIIAKLMFQKVEMTEAIDPVKRTIVRIPRLVKPQGRLRWIGDALVNTVCYSEHVFIFVNNYHSR